MTAQEMWEFYIKLHPEHVHRKYDAWCYGSDTADELARLTAAGIKTATASAYPLYVYENLELPPVGEFNVILLTDESALCVTKTTRVYVTSFKNVSAEHAFREGEGDRSLAYWRGVHESFFTEELKQIGMAFTENMEVVCEEFEVVYSI